MATLRQLCTWRGRLGRRAFWSYGSVVLLTKVLLDAVAVRLCAGQVWTPLDTISPLWRTRQRLGGMLAVAVFAWSVPFVWVGLALSARRCRDAGLRASWAVLATVPPVNWVFMAAMALWPSSPPAPTANATGVLGRSAVPPGRGAVAPSELWLAAAVAATLSLPLVIGCVELAHRYSSSLFVGGPFVVGLGAGWMAAGRSQPTRGQLFRLSLMTGCLSAIGLVCCALEGAICILMMIPLALPLVFLGSLLGCELRRQRGRASHVIPVLLVPFIGGLSPGPVGDRVPRPVRTQVRVAAPPIRVWRHVIAFDELPPTPWYFRLSGIAAPRRARIEGEGVGAIRHCEFTTGAFVEPITAWAPGERLAFDVVASPPSMRELTPFRHLHPPHLDAGFASRRGEFLLESDGEGGTLLTGTTWATLELEPVAYWRPLAEALVHQIHLQVLRHVARRAERDVG